MSLFVIADLHLSTAAETDKSMEVFGRRWTQYTERLEKNWRALITDDDTVVIPGDISWATTPDEALSDFRFLGQLPGKKLLGKGNHDFWWSSVTKMHRFLTENGISDMDFLYNNAHETDEYILCGTRGWFVDPGATGAPAGSDAEKLVARENIRLRLSLDAGRQLQRISGKEILVFLHFPPVWYDFVCEPLLQTLGDYGIRRCYYGHIHGNYTVPPTLSYRNIDFCITSADYLEFIPRLIRPSV